jgi:ATP-binding cassette subfamily B protein
VQTTAIIGSTGAGKSTLISLIPRYSMPRQGSVTVDGVEVRDCDPELLWSRIGFVPQKAFLFTGTWLAICDMANDATMKNCGYALRVAQRKTSCARCPCN